MVNPERRRERWGDYIERVALLAALLLIYLGFGAIQASRQDTIRRACVEQNVRHDQTLKKLDEQIERLPAGARKARAERNRDGTIALIDALVPKRDCDKRAKQLVE
jgi:hypothetical protein